MEIYESPPPRPTSKTHRTRVYEQWEGNEKIFCWGYLIAGPNWRASIGTALLIFAPAVIFWVFVAPYLSREVHAVIFVFSILLPLLCLFFLYMTACRDPGIIPRQEPDEEYLAGRKPRQKEVMVNGKKVAIRYNDTCHYYQPPRAHHCSVNDNCIERFDHHCPWVGTTIGARNYRTFLLFVNTTTVTCLYVFGCSLAMIFVKHSELQGEAQEGENTWGETVGDCIPAIVLMAYTFLLFWFVGGLSMFHCYLVGTNQTTYENFRYNDGENPYNLGLFQNCAEVWCTKVPESKVKFRAYVDEVQEEQRVAMASRQQERMLRERHEQQEQQEGSEESSRMNGVYEGRDIDADCHNNGHDDGEMDSFEGPHSTTLQSPYVNQQEQLHGGANGGAVGAQPTTPQAMLPQVTVDGTITSKTDASSVYATPQGGHSPSPRSHQFQP